MIELEIVSGAAAGQRLKTYAPTVSIGRAPEQTVVVPDRSVSRHHGEIVLLNAQYQYRDLNSTHGTTLRREGLDSPVRQVSLQEGDQLVLGLTDNIVRVLAVSLDLIESEDIALTMEHESVDTYAAPEKVFAHDSQALRTVVHMDTQLMDSTITTEREVVRTLLTHIPALFEKLDYVAVVEESCEGIRPYDYQILTERQRFA